MKEKTKMTTDPETIVRRAYHAAEGNVMDVQGFVDLFADDGEINAGTMNFRGEQLGWIVVFLAKFAPDVHRELHRVVVQDNIVAVELAIRGTFTGPYESPAGVLQPNGAKLDVPGADFWVVENGKIKQFNCHVSREHPARANGRAGRLRVRNQSADNREIMGWQGRSDSLTPMCPISRERSSSSPGSTPACAGELKRSY